MKRQPLHTLEPTAGATDGDVATFDAASNSIVLAAAAGGGGGSTALDDLTDVDVATAPPNDGDRLIFDSASGLWRPGATPVGVVENIDDLGDVDTSSAVPNDGDVLTYDSASGLWLPSAPSGGGGSGGSLGETFWQYEPWANRSNFSTTEVRVGVWGFAGSGLVGGSFFYNTSNAQNDSVAFPIWLGPGTYMLDAIVGTDSNRAIQTWEIDEGDGVFTTIGTFDCYTSGGVSDVQKQVTFTLSGSLVRRKLRCRAATRNASASGWYLGIQRLVVSLTAL